MKRETKNARPHLEEERPVIEFPALVWVVILLMSLILGLSILKLSPILSIVIFVGLVFIIAILLNPFMGIVLFLIGAYLKPVAYLPMLRQYHPATIAAMGIALIYGFHIIVYRDFKFIKSKQIYLMLAFTAMFFISSIYHYDAPGIKFEFMRFIQVVILYFLVAYMVKTEKQIYFLSCCLILIGVGTALSAFYYQIHGYGTLVTGGVARTAIFEGNPNYLALSLVMVIPFVLGFMFTFKNLIVKILLSLIAFLCIVATVFTFSRSGALGLVFVLALSAFKFVKKRGVFITAFLLIFILVISITLIPPQYWDRMATITKMEDFSIAGRLDVYRIATKIMFERPFTGIGLSLPAFEMEYYYKASSDPHVTNLVMGWTHNMFLEIGSKMGFVAMLFFIWFIIQVFIDTNKAAEIFKKNDKNMFRIITISIQVGLIGSIIMGMFMETVYDKLFWIYCALTVVLSNMAKKLTQI